MLAITERKLTWAFGLTLLVLAANALVSYRDLIEQARNMPLLAQSRQVLDAIGDVRSAIIDAETARRGFLIDGNHADLAAFEVAARNIRGDTDALAELTGNRPDQHPRIRELNQSALRCLAELRASIGQIQRRGFEASHESFRFDPIRHLVTDFRARIASIEAEEARSLARLVRERRAGITRAFVTFSVASTLALITIGTTYTLVLRYLRDRGEAERTLQESEAKIRLLFDSVGEGIYGIDTQGRCTFCNPSALRLLGFESIDQVLGRDMHQLVHHSHPDGTPFPSHLCPIYQTFRSGVGVLGIEDFFYRPDGLPVPVEYRAHAIHRDGAILGAVVTFLDMAPKRRAETEMRLRDRALRAIGQGVFIIDPALPGYPIVYANAAFERLTGYHRSDWSHLGFAWLHGEESAAEINELQLAVRERREVSVELLAHRKDGSAFWQSLTLAPVAASQGGVVHFVGVITDITERRSGDQKLRDSEGRLRLMIESVRDYAIFSIDLAGRVSSWNPGAERLFGFAERQILGEPAERLFTPEDQLSHVPAAELARADATDRADDERWHVRADGTRFFASGLVTAVRDPAGALLGFTKVARDITESKRVETELRAAKEAAESAIRAKNTFLANVGHEIRTPLNAIIGYSEMLEDEAIERGVREFVPDLKRIRGSGHLLLALLNNVLDLSKIEAGGMSLTCEPFDIGDLVRSVVRAVEPLAEQCGNVVQLEYPSDLGTLNADFTRIKQGLNHLLSNAVKFTEGGTIIVRVAREHDADQREWVVFTVADDGIGMTREETARLFQPFVQADGSAARRFGGTGLGLTITHRFCRLMGGTIDVTSQPGLGSTLTMRLPADRGLRPDGAIDQRGLTDQNQPLIGSRP